MGLNKESKQAVINAVSSVLESSQTIVIARYDGVTVDKMTAIRKQARAANVYLKVIKNTLVRKAVANTKFAPLADKMVGQLIYSASSDPIAAAKIIHDFAKGAEAVKIIAGMYNEKELDVNAIQKLASIPSRDELLAMLLGVMQQIPAQFVRCIDAIKKQKEQVA